MYEILYSLSSRSMLNARCKARKCENSVHSGRITAFPSCPVCVRNLA